MDIKELISAVKKRPEMYLGDVPDISNLSYYLDGFLASNLINLNNKTDRLFKYEFHDWIRLRLERKFGINFENKSDHFKNYIRQVCHSDRESLDLFFELTDIYFKELDKNG